MSDVTRINVNGRDYDSVEQMPPEVRAEYLQALAAMRRADAENTTEEVTHSGLTHSVVHESFIYNGREYRSRDELPPEARALLEQMAGSLPDAKRSEVKIETVKTFPSEVRVIEEFGNERRTTGKEPGSAWLLVKILGALVLVLLFLLLWLGLKHGG